MLRPDARIAQTNGLATASLVLGVLSLVLFFTFVIILAIVFGAIGVSRANQGAPNRSMAVAGLVLGIAGIVVGIFFVASITTSVRQVDGHFGRSIQVCMNDRSC
ncbi:MAG: DUF4190 domain-containing protein [Actinobacteria bacterium]|nr:MAG: DUF4190 domain-containing protein [Actinomycetota bacterium]